MVSEDGGSPYIPYSLCRIALMVVHQFRTPFLSPAMVHEVSLRISYGPDSRVVKALDDLFWSMILHPGGRSSRHLYGRQQCMGLFCILDFSMRDVRFGKSEIMEREKVIVHLSLFQI